MKHNHLLLVFVLFAVIFSAAPVNAERPTVTIIVNTTLDGGQDGLCSLREAITAANKNIIVDGCAAGSPGGIPADVIQFSTPGTATITLTREGSEEEENLTGDLDIHESVVISGGPSPAQQIIIGKNDRVFDIHNGVVTLEGFSVIRGFTEQGGGGIRANGASLLVLSKMNIAENRANWGGGVDGGQRIVVRQSSITNNVAEGVGINNGGGINSPGEVIIENSTIAFNRADGDGGGIWLGNDSMSTLRNSTISQNNPGGIALYEAHVTMQDTIFWSNIGADCEIDASGGEAKFVSLGYNFLPDRTSCGTATGTDFVGVDPIFGVYGDHGGTTTGFSLFKPYSPAIDSGSCSGGAINVDQYGRQRPQGDGCDIGAYEVPSDSSSADGIVVNTTLDGGTDGLCSLREAISAANSNVAVDGCGAGNVGDFPADVIRFAENLTGTVFELTKQGAFEDANATGDLDIHESVNILGAPFSNRLTIKGIGDRVFEIHQGAVTLQGLEVTGGLTNGLGGGIRAKDSTFLTLENMSVHKNVGGGGGGVYSGNRLVVHQSSFTENRAQAGGFNAGGGIQAYGTLFVENSFVGSNMAQDEGGGIWIGSTDTPAVVRNSSIVENNQGALILHTAEVTIQDTIIWHNLNALQDCGFSQFDGSGTFESLGNNLLPDRAGCGAALDSDIIGGDPGGAFFQLADGTRTFRILDPNSPVIDSGSCSGGEVVVDQRGLERPQGEACDIGAYEVAADEGDLPQVNLPLVIWHK